MDRDYYRNTMPAVVDWVEQELQRSFEDVKTLDIQAVLVSTAGLKPWLTSAPTGDYDITATFADGAIIPRRFSSKQWRGVQE